MNIFQIQKQLIKNIENPIIFDVGAWFGDTAISYAKEFPNSVIYSFEPSKECYDNMVNVTKLPSNVRPFNLALGNENKDVDFNINLEQQTNSLLSTHPDAEKTWGCKACDHVRTELVKMQTIDEFVKINNIEKIDILKMDTQGTESLILEGAIETINQNKIKLVYTEIIIMPTYIGQKPLDEALYDYRKNGFILYNFYFNPVGQVQQIEALFIHESFYKEINKNNVL